MTNRREPITPWSSIDHHSPISIDDGTEMFIDQRLIDRSDGIDLRLNPPIRREVVLTTDRPWEGPNSAYYTVHRDGDRIRLYYRGFSPNDASDASNLQVTCMAESADGIHFDRPNLGLFDFNGSKANNIVYRGVEAHNFAPFIDTNPCASPEERYKAVGGVESRLYAFASPDGIRWKKRSEAPILTDGAFDSLNAAFWDAVAGVYRCYSRCWTGGGYAGYRAIQSSISTDFVSWSRSEPNRYPEDAPWEHFYTNATAPCPGAERILLSFPMRFVPDRTKLANYDEPGVSDALFMSSRDGVSWDRTFREVWIRPGPDERNWTQRSNMPARGIIKTESDEFSLYVSEHYGWPDNRLRRVTVRRHGFASLHAGPDGGEAFTHPIAIASDALRLNYATSASGAIRVEVRDESDRPIPGYSLSDATPLFGDAIDEPVQWRASRSAGVSGRTERPVRLRFVLNDADLYAFRQSDEARIVA